MQKARSDSERSEEHHLSELPFPRACDHSHMLRVFWCALLRFLSPKNPTYPTELTLHCFTNIADDLPGILRWIIPFLISIFPKPLI